MGIPFAFGRDQRHTFGFEKSRNSQLSAEELKDDLSIVNKVPVVVEHTQFQASIRRSMYVGRISMKYNTLSLLDDPCAFSQRHLMTPDEFLASCEKRRAGLHTNDYYGLPQLAALHQAGILVPIFRVQLPWSEDSGTDEESEPSRKFASPFMVKDQPHVLNHNGLLFDASSERFVPWSKYSNESDYGVSWSHTFLYSPYQLLHIPEIKSIKGAWKFDRKKESDFDRRFRLASNKGINEIRDNIDRIGKIIILLTSIEALYYPNIPKRTTIHLTGLKYSEWSIYREKTDRLEIMKKWGYTSDEVLRDAEHLLTVAHNIDPLDEWSDLLRQCDKDKLEQLKYDALVAYDYKVAAEMLFRFYEDLASLGAAQALEPLGKYWDLRHIRLDTKTERLDRTLMEYGISPHPSLILALEGESEMAIMPKVLDLIGVNYKGNLLRLMNYSGISASFFLLVSYATTPLIGEWDLGLGANGILPIDRPPTKIFQVLDSEGNFTTEKDRKDWKDTMVEHIMKQLSHLDRSIVISQVEDQVQIDTWADGAPFEFSHYSDKEIAETMQVEERYISERRSSGKIEPKDIWKKVVKDGGRVPNNPIVTKPDLNVRLWPVLEKKIHSALGDGRIDDVPILRIAFKAWRIAANTRRKDVGFKVEP